MKKLFFIFAVVFAIALQSCAQESLWEVKHYSDEFGDEDESAGSYLSYFKMNNGKFSNSISTNSKLTAIIFVSSSNLVTVKLVEYDYRVVKAYSFKRYTALIKDDNNVKNILRGSISMPEGSDVISFGSENSKILINAMKKNSKLKFSIMEVSDGYPSSYMFVINCNGFTGVLSKIVK